MSEGELLDESKHVVSEDVLDELNLSNKSVSGCLALFPLSCFCSAWLASSPWPLPLFLSRLWLLPVQEAFAIFVQLHDDLPDLVSDHTHGHCLHCFWLWFQPFLTVSVPTSEHFCVSGIGTNCTCSYPEVLLSRKATPYRPLLHPHLWAHPYC